MQLDVIGRDLEISESLNRHAHRRAQFAFDRVADRIERIVIRVSDMRSPRGGESRHCQVRVDLGGGGSLVLEAYDSCPYTAVDRTVGRMKRVVKEHLARARTKRRERRRNSPRTRGTLELG